MMRLVRAELLRSWSRLLVWATVAATLVICGVVAFNTLSTTAPPSEQEVAEQTKFFNEAYQDWEANHEAWYQDCLDSEAQEREALDDPTIDWACEDNNEAPKLEDWFYNPTARDIAPYTVGGLLQTLLAGSFVIGASLLAAEVASGNLGLWLTFAPRRTTVLASKLVAVALTSLVYATLGAAVALAALAGPAAINGTLDLSPLEWRDLTLMAVRSTILAVVVGVVGGALGLLLRHTAAALGAAFGYLFVFELMLGFNAGSMRRWMLVPNISAVIDGRHELSWIECKVDRSTGEQVCADVTKVLTQADGALYLGALAAAIVLVTWLVFRRRDVS
ncbi:ABC-2 type transport system permease protein [Flavimobilis soli]|uniref:ABC-2 type transport system permease protein n=1 Tax=Flavimobilis soli TaxID=442709 RepID=A0A2A9EEZ7_9MICO|nr:ABC transporter permease subunit [Flavimobilis soli]PFG36855.1 ABC-2 type transport system permease protein [Flavimobilis soli]